MLGKLYGVGVGPGDPELMTLKAVKTIEEADIIMAPTKEIEKSVAYQIALKNVPSMADKERIGLDIPMVKDKDRVRQAHIEASAIIEEKLKEGKKVVFIALGDISIYASFSYIHAIIKERGYETVMISGIPSFIAIAAKLNIPLVLDDEILEIIPATYYFEKPSVKTNKVYMKAGNCIEYLKPEMAKAKEAYILENLGMENERILQKEEIAKNIDKFGYFTTGIIKN